MCHDSIGLNLEQELEDASYSLPRAMMYSTLANGFMGLIMIISYCYCIGDILEGLSCRFTSSR